MTIKIKPQGRTQEVVGTETDLTPFAVDVAAIYAANDGVGNTLRFEGSAGLGGGAQKLRAVITDREGHFNGAAMELWIYNAVPVTPSADNAAFVQDDADDDKLSTIIPIAAGDWFGAGGSKAVAVSPVVEVTRSAAHGDGLPLYGRLVTRSATPVAFAAASSVIVKLVATLD